MFSDLSLQALEPPQWPPRSPYEAILNSPSSRQKLQQRQNRLSPSPSPLKRSATTSALRPQRKLDYQPMEDNEDEDEETLQLRLEALEARLKLKRLQSKKAKANASGSDVECEDGNGPKSKRGASSLYSLRKAVGNSSHSLLPLSKSSGDIQVPLSPERKPTTAQEQRSPGRVLLGIDKGLSAKNVSLRRAPKLRTASSSNEDPFGATSLQTFTARGLDREHHTNGGPAVKSFNERIAESRLCEKEAQERKQRSERLRKQKASGFGVQQEDIDAFKSASFEEEKRVQKTTSAATEQRGFSRDEVIKAVNKPAGGLVQRSNTVSGAHNSRRTKTSSTISSDEVFVRPKSAASASTTNAFDRPSRQTSISLLDDSSRPNAPVSAPSDSSLFEGYSSINLSRRVLPHTFLKRTLEGKTPVLIPDLLRTVKAPDFSLPPPSMIPTSSSLASSPPNPRPLRTKTHTEPTLPWPPTLRRPRTKNPLPHPPTRGATSWP